MGLTAQRDRANPAAMPQCIVAMPFELKPCISSDIVRQIEYWFPHIMTSEMTSETTSEIRNDVK